MSGQLITEFDGACPPPCIIVVDDEVPNMEALCITLRSNGYETIGFSSSSKALDAIRTGKFDILLTDP